MSKFNYTPPLLGFLVPNVVVPWKPLQVRVVDTKDIFLKNKIKWGY